MYKAVLVCFILIAVLGGCTRDQAPGNNACTTCPTISFQTDIIPIFRANCAISGCHTGAPGGAAGNVSLDSAIAYVQATYPGKGYVIAGSPNSSIIYSQLLVGSSDHMPQGGQLDACSIQKIYCWIQQGALNN